MKTITRQQPENFISKSLFEVKSFDDENFIIRGIFSTPEIDRQGESIDQAGWKLDNYMKNPVILWAHDHETPAIGQMIELMKDATGNLVGAIKFAVAEYDFAETIYNLMKGGYIRAFSVGFSNNVYEIDQENDTVVLKDNELYEVSVVNVPANAGALALAAAKGINVEPLNKFLSTEKKEKPAEVALEKTVVELTEALKSADEKTIRQAISTLTEALETAGTDKKVDKVETPVKQGGTKKISVDVFNKAIRELLRAKKSLT